MKYNSELPSSFIYLWIYLLYWSIVFELVAVNDPTKFVSKCYLYFSTKLGKGAWNFSIELLPSTFSTKKVSSMTASV